jgi:CRISPR-associated protein Cmr3
MINYQITPAQPLIFRDGKPFGTEDNIADTLAFPLPSTLAGAMRTAWAESQDVFDYSNADQIEKLRNKKVCGPLLTLTTTQDKTDILFPAPADSLCLHGENDGTKIYRLRPEMLQPGEGTDLPHNLLSPVFLSVDNKEKPARNSPKFWYREKMIGWLSSDDSNGLTASEQGIQNLPIETRTHVGIDPKTQAAKSGHLFQTAGLDFGRQRKQNNEDNNQHWGWDKQEFGLACAFQGEMSSTFRTIGGESRLGRISRQDKLIPECPTELVSALNQTKGFRLILATPAIFANGCLPDWLDQKTLEANYRDMKLRLHAVSIPRWQAGTSWDMANKASKQGKAMRSLKRLAPAGTVYWFERLSGSMDVEGFWLTSISDERSNDGYGLTLPGTWNMDDFNNKH